MQATLKCFIVLSIVLCLVLASEHTQTIGNFRACIKKCRFSQKLQSKFDCLKQCTPEVFGAPSTKLLAKNEKTDTVEEKSDTETSNIGNVMTQQELWGKYRQVLWEFLQRGDPKAYPGLIYVASPISADWHNNYNILKYFADSVPKPTSTYDPSTNKVSEQYKAFLSNIKSPEISPDNQALLTAASNKFKTANLQFFAAIDECKQKYEQYKDYVNLPLEEFKYEYCPSIKMQEAQTQALNQEMAQLSRRLYGEYILIKDALEIYNRTQKTYHAVGSMKEFVDSVKKNQANPFNVTISSSTKSSTETSSSLSVGTSVSFWWFSASASHERSTFDLKTSSTDFQLSISAAGYKYFPIENDNWMVMSTLLKFKNAQQNYPHNFFRTKDGTFSMMPKGIFAIVAPRITMIVSKEDASKFEDAQKTGTSVGIGLFKFDFSKGSSLKTDNYANGLVKVTVEGNGYDPQALAVDNHLLYQM